MFIVTPFSAVSSFDLKPLDFEGFRKYRKPMETNREKITANGVSINIFNNDGNTDFISLTDIAKYKNKSESNVIIQNWLRLRSTIEFLALWESINNPDFNNEAADQFMNESGGNAFVLSPKKWIESTGAIGISSKPGRGGGTYAQSDIAFNFASWISPSFHLYVITDYQRLKQDESNKLNLDWNLNRNLSKINYRFHTDAIKNNLIDTNTPKRLAGYTYANEADRLNMIVFGMTASEWRENNKKIKGNIRDNADINQLLILANLESFNAQLIREGISDEDRTLKLIDMAKSQLKGIDDRHLLE